jgi:hypothetical protein
MVLERLARLLHDICLNQVRARPPLARPLSLRMQAETQMTPNALAVVVGRTLLGPIDVDGLAGAAVGKTLSVAAMQQLAGAVQSEPIARLFSVLINEVAVVFSMAPPGARRPDPPARVRRGCARGHSKLIVLTARRRCAARQPAVAREGGQGGSEHAAILHCSRRAHTTNLRSATAPAGAAHSDRQHRGQLDDLGSTRRRCARQARREQPVPQRARARRGQRAPRSAAAAQPSR